jgi:hypothetical protein
MKGQSSMELLVTFGVVIAFSLPILFLIYSISSVGYEDTSKAQADASARSLADSINLIYTQGDGAKSSVLLNLPATTQNITVGRGEVIVEIKTSKGVYHATSPIIAYSNSYSPPVASRKSGLYRLFLENRDGVVVLHETSTG